MDFILGILCSFLNHSPWQKPTANLWARPVESPHSKELRPANSYVSELGNISSHHLPQMSLQMRLLPSQQLDCNLVRDVLAKGTQQSCTQGFTPIEIIRW